jgi:hypothetical protein
VELLLPQYNKCWLTHAMLAADHSLTAVIIGPAQIASDILLNNRKEFFNSRDSLI